MAVVLAIIFAFLIASLIGNKREIGFWWSFAACLLLSPIIGFIITICSKRLSDEQEPAELEEMKPLKEGIPEPIIPVNDIVDSTPITEEADPTIIDY